jgi:kinesin family protein 4/21/27
LNNGVCTKPAIHQKPMLQIREATNGEITLSGVTDCEVSSLHEMATLLELGSLSRATASTNMNLQSRYCSCYTVKLLYAMFAQKSKFLA